MVLNTTIFQRILIYKIYLKTRKNKFDKVEITTLSKNKDKALYFLRELEANDFVVVIDKLTSETNSYTRTLLGGVINVEPFEVKLTDKGRFFYSVLYSHYLESLVKSILIPIIISILTTVFMHHFIK